MGDQQHHDAWMEHVRRGDFEAAWKVSDRVLRERAGVPCEHLPRHLQYFWDGEPLDGDDYQLIRDVWAKWRARVSS